MIGNIIKRLRAERGMTQKDLADRLYVTPQAVSRWENDLVEPNITTIAEMSKIFNVSTNVILGIEEDEVQEGIETEELLADSSINDDIINTPIEPARPVLAVCESCNKLIYDPEDICRSSYAGVTHVTCQDCERQRLEQIAERHNKTAKKSRILSYVIGGIIAALMLAFGIIGVSGGEAEAADYVIMISMPILLFTFTSCLFLHNNFIFTMNEWAFMTGFRRMPGLIFELSLDGILWLLTVKLLLWILNLLLTIIIVLAVFIISLPLSLIAYPFAMVKSFKHPEDVE